MTEEESQAVMLAAISMGEWAQRLERREHARQTIRPMSYIAMLPHIVETARAHGYAIGVHGSMIRDLDLIAAPWTEAASPAEELAEAVCGAVGGVFARNAAGGPRVNEKPHGRRAWLFYCGSLIIDLSILPRSPR